MEFLKGKKTYIGALIVAVVAVLNYFGVLTPDLNETLLALGGALGIAGLRNALK